MPHAGLEIPRPSPCFVSSIKTVAGVDVFESPPSCQTRQFSTPHSVNFTMCGNGRHEIEEVEHDLGSGIGSDADGNKCGKCIAGIAGIYTRISDRRDVGGRDRLPCSPILKSSYASQVTMPPASLLQHHLMTLQRTWPTQMTLLRDRDVLTKGSVNRSSWARCSPFKGAPRSGLALK